MGGGGSKCGSRREATGKHVMMSAAFYTAETWWSGSYKREQREKDRK